MNPLQKKYGPLPLWGWLATAGVGLGLFYLYKRRKANQPEGNEPILEHLQAGAPTLESPGGGGMSAGESLDLYKRLGEAEAKASSAGLTAATIPTETGSHSATPVSDFIGEFNELRAAGFTIPGPSGSQAPATAAALQAASGGTPGRGGVPYHTGDYHGHAAHIYSRAVPGGVGPGKNVIVLGGPRPVGHQHQKAGSHAPAHTKARKPPVKHSPPARPRVHTVKHGKARKR